MTISLKRPKDYMPYLTGRHPTGEINSFLQTSIVDMLLEPSSWKLTKLGVRYQDHCPVKASSCAHMTSACQLPCRPVGISLRNKLWTERLIIWSIRWVIKRGRPLPLFPVPLFDVPLVIEIFAPILGQFLLFLLPEEQQQQTYRVAWNFRGSLFLWISRIFRWFAKIRSRENKLPRKKNPRKFTPFI